MLNKKVVAVFLGTLLAFSFVSQKFFKLRDAQAQNTCVDFKLVSKVGPGVFCGDNWTKINETQVDNCIALKCVESRYVAMCIGGP